MPHLLSHSPPGSRSSVTVCRDDDDGGGDDKGEDSQSALLGGASGSAPGRASPPPPPAAGRRRRKLVKDPGGSARPRFSVEIGEGDPTADGRERGGEGKDEQKAAVVARKGVVGRLVGFCRGGGG